MLAGTPAAAAEGGLPAAQTADLAITQTAPTSVSPGDPTYPITFIAYTLTVTNYGPDAASNVTFADPQPAQTTWFDIGQISGQDAFVCQSGVICTVATMAAGNSDTFTVQVATPNPSASITITNSATVSSASTDPNPNNNTSTFSTTIAIPVANLAVAAAGPAEARAGSTVTYTVTLTNNGPDAASYVWLFESAAPLTLVSFQHTSGPDDFGCWISSLPPYLPPFCSTLTMAAGNTDIFEAVVSIDASASGTFDNSFSVSSGPQRNVYGSGATVSTSVVPLKTDLAITGSGPASAARGSTITYRLRVTNTGPDAAAGVALTDPVPAQTAFVSVAHSSGLDAFNCEALPPSTPPTCRLGTMMAAGSTDTFELVVTANANASGVIINTATVSSLTTDPNLGNDTSMINTTIDVTPPVITSSIRGVQGSNGWYRGDVTVSWSVTDPESGIASSSGCSTTTLTTDTPGTTLTCSATNGVGLSASQSVTVKLDKTPPVTTARLTGLSGDNGWYRGPVTLKLSATDNLSGVSSTSYSKDAGATWVTYDPMSPPVFTTDGQSVVQFRSTDKAGNLETPAKSASIKLDQTPPLVTCAASPTMLWPPNHDLRPVSATVTVRDAVSGPSGFVLTSVTSNEPDQGVGDGDMPGDIQGWVLGTATRTGQLRAERSGSGSGRVYTLTYTGADQAGNLATCETIVSVPHDRSP